jgi:NAD(P)-dependent dehydrogenase (short-subunit alcohol dehydrogenase family)
MSAVLERFSLEGKVALLTGGAGLYGKQITEALSQAGAITCIASRNLESLQEIAKKYSNVHPFALDLENEDSIRNVVAEIIAKFGKIDILVNNAVTRCACGSWKNLSMDDFDKSLRINGSSLFLLTRLAAEDMAKRQEGSIINIGSYMGNLGPNEPLYEGTDGMSALGAADYFYHKSGMHNVTRFLAGKYGPHGIRCNCLALGGLFANQHPAFVENYSNATYMGRLAKEDDVKGIIVYLASDASAYHTGTVIPLDGGYSAK